MSSYSGQDTAEKQRDLRRAMKTKQKASSKKSKDNSIEVDRSLLQNRGVLNVTCQLAQDILDKEQKHWRSDQSIVECLLKFLTGGQKRFFICDVHDDVPVQKVWINQYGFRPNRESKFFFVKGVNLQLTHNEQTYLIFIIRRDGQLAFQVTVEPKPKELSDEN